MKAALEASAAAARAVQAGASPSCAAPAGLLAVQVYEEAAKHGVSAMSADAAAAALLWQEKTWNPRTKHWIA